MPHRRHPCRFLFAAGLFSLAVSSGIGVQLEHRGEILPRTAADGAAAPAPVAEGTGWRPLWDGNQMPGWRVVEFGGDGESTLTNGVLTIGSGMPLSGLVYTNPLPRMEYEIELETQRVSGHDFACGLTFPVADACCTFIFGGWGGGVIGISSINGLDASENSTGIYRDIETGRWYHLRIRVETGQIRVWLDRELIIRQELGDCKIGMRPGAIELCQPFGLSTYETVGAIRGLRLRRLSRTADAKP